uniref:Ankyrin repeat protein n=1 Tax=viral metagenome TaxID=1070528 RepID=A0A6C0LZT7_9ZZZZ
MSSVCKKCLKTIKRERVVVTSDGRIGCICDRKTSHDLYHKTKETARVKDRESKRYGSMSSIAECIKLGDIATVKEMASMYDENRMQIMPSIMMACAEYDRPDIMKEMVETTVSEFFDPNNEAPEATKFYEEYIGCMGFIPAIIRSLVLGHKSIFDAFCLTDLVKHNYEMFLYAAVKDGTYKTLDILMEYEGGDQNGCAKACAFFGYIDFLRYVITTHDNEYEDVFAATVEAARGNQPLVIRFLHNEYHDTFMQTLNPAFINATMSVDMAIMLHDEFGATNVTICMVNAIIQDNYDLFVLCHDTWKVACDDRIVYGVVRSHCQEFLNMAYVDRLHEWGASTDRIIEIAQKYGDEAIINRAKEWA